MSLLHCGACRTELPPDVLVCPACGALVHADRLKRLAADADAAHRRGESAAARTYWSDALALLPADSQQHAIVSKQIAGLTNVVDTSAPGSGATAATGTTATTAAGDHLPWWKRGWPGFATGVLLLAGKLKFLLLGLTKASTFVSMFAFFGVYWSIYGWPLALGLVVAIYIHEMGHVAMLRQFGIDAGAPMFIPGVGAFVMLKQRVDDPLIDAKIGLAGPVWGLGAAVAALAIYAATKSPIWLAIAHLTGFLNLFNLIPVWQLDGSRGIHVLARWERWTLVAAILIALVLTEQRLLLLVGGVAVWRAFQKDAGPGDARVLLTFVGLIAALSWLARTVG